ncbi:MAG: hypothetical protein L0Y73_04345, partial [Candidatus Aminicenantes bacterium]|nr:hypothetical protein [Candidatus Aminicenantes bacterium]
MENRGSTDRLALAASQNIKERDFWLDQLSGDPVKTRFPYDFEYKNEDRQKCDMARMEFSFPGETLEKIKKLSKGV